MHFSWTVFDCVFLKFLEHFILPFADKFYKDVDFIFL